MYVWTIDLSISLPDLASTLDCLDLEKYFEFGWDRRQVVKLKGFNVPADVRRYPELPAAIPNTRKICVCWEFERYFQSYKRRKHFLLFGLNGRNLKRSVVSTGTLKPFILITWGRLCLNSVNFWRSKWSRVAVRCLVDSRATAATNKYNFSCVWNQSGQLWAKPGIYRHVENIYLYDLMTISSRVHVTFEFQAI